MQSHYKNSLKTQPLIDIKKLLDSTLPVQISTAEQTRTIALNMLLTENFEAKKPVIFTFTSGPFQDKDLLPNDWKITPAVNGCTVQLKTFEANYARLNATIIALNKHPAEYQQELIKDKEIPHLQMISDASGEIEKLLGISNELITVNNARYFPHFSLVLTPRGRSVESKGFRLQSPVTAEIAENHISDIQEFMQPELTDQLNAKP